MKILQSPEINAFGGINFVLQYLDELRISDLLDQHLPDLHAQSRYSWKDITYSLLSIYLCGGDCIEDLQTHLKSHFSRNPFFQMPSPDTVLKRLNELSAEGTTCQTARGSVTHELNINKPLEELNVSVLKRLGYFNKKEITLDYDNTIIFNEKRDSRMTYKRGYGYQPGVCTINEEQVLYIENRNGNSDAKSFQKETMTRIFDLLTRSGIRKVDHFRADAASYQYEVIQLLDEHVRWFYVGCRNSYIEKYFCQVAQWETCHDPWGETMEIGEVIISPFTKYYTKGQKPKQYRLIVKRRLSKDKQMNLFTKDAYEYRAIITNNFSYTPAEIAHFYNHRGNMERQFDVLKNDFGWNNMPFSEMKSNTVYLYLMAICRNLFSKIIEYFSSKSKHLKPSFRVKKFLFRFIILPSRWIKSAGQMKLRVYGKINYCT